MPHAQRTPSALNDSPGYGLLAGQRIRQLASQNAIRASMAYVDSQFQPASLDLRLGAKAFRVRASFLPGKARTVAHQLDALSYDEINLTNGAVLERGCVYVVPLLESLALPADIAALANPKSSTGRLDIFTRLISDHSEVFDRAEAGYHGPLYAEISPRSFSIRVRTGTRLNQIRFRRLQADHMLATDFSLPDAQLRNWHENISPLINGEANIRNGLILRVALARESVGELIGYRAQKHTDVVDVERINHYAVRDFWEPIAAREDRRLILDPDEFYILASQERLHIPPGLAAEMAPIDPAMGEFRVHYAGFFDPGFGWSPQGSKNGHPGSRGVLEVRSHEVPFILEDGQIIGRLAYERMAEDPDVLYGQTPVSNYQGQDLKLSKHFRM
ncbi:MAG: 2'-deoxycytidine 5'-triphosphate deaminase [Alphaproteobacteria bacterium]|nr:2'-deoxycytidine 5'-triphosphate deaminase [Alphaproteobacteria bacterium]